ncbi:MAG: hypothetical protein VCB25_00650, partial [Myxococcota bacterium]
WAPRPWITSSPTAAANGETSAGAPLSPSPSPSPNLSPNRKLLRRQNLSLSRWLNAPPLASHRAVSAQKAAAAKSAAPAEAAGNAATKPMMRKRKSQSATVEPDVDAVANLSF